MLVDAFHEIVDFAVHFRSVLFRGITSCAVVCGDDKYDRKDDYTTPTTPTSIPYFNLLDTLNPPDIFAFSNSYILFKLLFFTFRRNILLLVKIRERLIELGKKLSTKTIALEALMGMAWASNESLVEGIEIRDESGKPVKAGVTLFTPSGIIQGELAEKDKDILLFNQLYDLQRENFIKENPDAEVTGSGHIILKNAVIFSPSHPEIKNRCAKLIVFVEDITAMWFATIDEDDEDN